MAQAASAAGQRLSCLGTRLRRNEQSDPGTNRQSNQQSGGEDGGTPFPGRGSLSAGPSALATSSSSRSGPRGNQLHL